MIPKLSINDCTAGCSLTVIKNKILDNKNWVLIEIPLSYPQGKN